MTKKDNNVWVEDLLAENPLNVDDNGFSIKVLAKVHSTQTRRLKILAPFFAAGIAALLAFFPYEIFDAIGQAATADFHAMLPTLVPTLMVLGMVLFFNFVEESR